MEFFIVFMALTVTLISLTFFCLKIKSTKKTPELLGTVGTVKPLDDYDSSENAASFHVKSSPVSRLRPVSTISDVIHNNDNGNQESNRTPSRAGERKLPDIPKNENNHDQGSDLYATLGSALANSDSEEAETEPIESNHPYAKVKKIRDHPYATVNKSDGSSAPSTSTAAPPIPPPPPEVELRPQPQAQQQYFSGDSQDSSKGYTSISVREPLRHIRTTMPNQDRSGSMSNQQNYAAVSEASDDMYAAIEDPTYIPTGNQSNSDTYAVIQLPEEIDEIDASYSQVDKSRKRNKAPPAPAGAAGGASAKNASSSESNNVNDMYAKVHKNRGEVDNLPMGASAMRTSKEHLLGGARGARDARSRHHINYSDYEVAHYDPSTSSSKKDLNEVGYETVPEKVLPPTRSFDHEGYERVQDYYDGYELLRENSSKRGSGRGGDRGPFNRLTFSSSSNRSNKKTDPGYETVRDPASPRPPLPRMTSHPGLQPEPPYAQVEKYEDQSEEGYETIPDNARMGLNSERISSEPGYETVPTPIRDQHRIGIDPGYETVPNQGSTIIRSSGGSGIDPGYETVPNEIGLHRTAAPDPGYEMVQTKAEPGYETVSYEQPKYQASSTSSSMHHHHHSNSLNTSTVNVVHMSVRKTNSDPPVNAPTPVLAPPMLLPRSGHHPSNPNSKWNNTSRTLENNSSVVVIEHKTKAVNNNFEVLDTTATTSTTTKEREREEAKRSSNNEIQSHIFV